MLTPVRQSARPIIRCLAQRWPSAITHAHLPCYRQQPLDHSDARCGSRGFAVSTLRNVPTEADIAVDGPRDGTAATTPTLVSALQVAAEDHPSRPKKLPITCAGCGAFSQTVEPDIAGFYSDRGAKSARQKSDHEQSQDQIYEQVLGAGRLSFSAEQQIDGISPADQNFCDRCRGLMFQSKGNSIIHPSMLSIQKIIEESPHRHNHIYHVVDAADFPMSLIPNLLSALHLPKMRTRNRRSNHIRYLRGRVAEVSFIITRSDLLAPKKEAVDRMLPYLREVLRGALSRASRNARLGNVRCISAHRGWWTKTLKEEIWQRGGAGWMVGKVNVGKSALFEAVFPKGRNQKQDVNITRMRLEEERQRPAEQPAPSGHAGSSSPGPELDEEDLEDLWEEALNPSEDTASPNTSNNADTKANASGDLKFLDSLERPTADEMANPASYTPLARGQSLAATDRNASKTTDSLDTEGDDEDYVFDEDDGGSLLPPLRRETQYPAMPIVSALPGTTASPIRIPFGNSKGELIDLPGVERGALAEHVQPAHHRELIMQSRVVPQQYNIKPGQSLLIGGLVRITPKTDDLVFLAYPFVPLKAHITATDKAIGITTGTMPDGEKYDGFVETIATPEAQTTMQHAGTFKLRWDVTKQSAGPLTDKTVGKRKAEDLPFIVWSADLLLEGVGWIELTCQTRNRRRSRLSPSGGPLEDAWGPVPFDPEEGLPEIDVWTPKGKFVGLRPPMSAWATSGPKKVAASRQRKRPRQTISLQRRRAGGARGSSS